MRKTASKIARWFHSYVLYIGSFATTAVVDLCNKKLWCMGAFLVTIWDIVGKR